MDERIPLRRKFFPSWAWVGWEGGIVHDHDSGCLGVDSISLELDTGQRVLLSLLFSVERACTWEAFSQPEVLVWRTIFIDTSTAHTFATYECVLHFRLTKYTEPIKLSLSIQHNSDEGVRFMFLQGQYKIMRLVDYAGLVVDTGGNSHVRIGTAQQLPHEREGFDSKHVEVHLA